MGIFLSTNSLMNTVNTLHYQISDVASLDGHGYADKWMTVNGADASNTTLRKVYSGYRFDESNAAVTTFTTPTTNPMRKSATSTDGLDVMTTGGQTDTESNSAVVNQFRAIDSTVITKINSPQLTDGRQEAVGTASYRHSHFAIGGKQGTTIISSINAIHYDVLATTQAQGNLSGAGTNPRGCGNGRAAMYRHQDATFRDLEIINIADHTGGTYTSYISNVTATGTLLSGASFLAAASSGDNAVWIGGTQITAIRWDDSYSESIWATSITNFNRGAADSDGTDIVFNGGTTSGSDAIYYIRAEQGNLNYRTSSQTLAEPIKQHSCIAYQ